MTKSVAKQLTPLIIALGATTLSCLFSVSVNADDLETSMHNRIAEIEQSESQRSRKARASAEFKARKLVESIENSVAARQTPQPSMPKLGDVAIHIKGNSEVKFPDPSAVVLDPGSRPPFDWDAFISKKVRIFPPAPPATLPRRCSENTTQRVERPGMKGPNKALFYDVLYLPEDMVPLDSTEVYGKNTTLRSYTNDGPQAVIDTMALDGVPCLPYRIRITDTYELYDRGWNAYRNYDKDPLHNGPFHDWVQVKLGLKRQR